MPPKAGLLAMMGGGGDESTSDPLADKKRALREMFSAAKSGDWEGAAHAFQEAYDLCAGLGAEESEDDELELEE